MHHLTLSKHREQGFTLIELLVVIIIVGVLASIATPVYLVQRKRAFDAGVKSDMRTVVREIESDTLDSGMYPVTSNPNTWVAAGTSNVQTTAVVAPDARLSSGTRIQYRSNGLGDGYCLRAGNPSANADWSSKAYWYTSARGGIVPGPATNNYPVTC